jgi:hypothetical protein
MSKQTTSALEVLGMSGALVLCGWLAAPVVAQPPADPTDLLREHVEMISSPSHEYAIEMGGTMDGRSTRDPIGYAAWDQVFEPNRFVRLENVGETPVVNPWLLVNGKHRWRTVADIVEEIMGGLPPNASDAERARAVWEFEKHHRFHATTGDAECLDPVKVFNGYGYTLCGDDAQVIADLWRAAGFETRRGRPQGHCTTEVLCGGDWHLLDGDENIICLLRDNETIAQEADIVRDHDLMKRTHTYGILAGDSRNTDEFSASLCVYDGDDRTGDWQSHVGHTMDFTLRSGESIEWRWDHREKAHGTWEGQSLLTGWGATAWARHCNGYWRYAPKLIRHPFLDGLVSKQNLATFTSRSPLLHLAEAGKPASFAIEMRVPYVLVGGRVKLRGLRASAEDRIALSLSYDGKEWTPVTEVGETGAFETTADLDRLLPMNGPARYSYQLRVEMEAPRFADAVGVDGLLIENDLQMAVLSLPALTLGANRVTYTDESPGPRSVRVTHSWVERSSSRPPSAPSAALYPPNKGEAEGTRFVFGWQPATDPDGDAIEDYHFQLSNRPDMRWPLSPNFDRLIARTPDKGAAKYTLPYAGLLNPDQTYYWRVRARDDKGVWGHWSATWTFTPRGPGVPLNLYLRPEGEGWVLGWQPNPKGRRPTAYRVYGSDEKGFSVSDVPYKVNVGNQDDGRSPDFPANLVAEITGTKLQAIGADVTLPNASKAFYRVVAVDEKGNRSGPSDYVAVPRPLIYTSPVLPAQAGEAWEYHAATIRSTGDLRSHTIEGKGVYNAAFWDEEKPEWSLTEAPEWLAVDPHSGLVSGTPPAAGSYPVTLSASIAGTGQAEQSFALTVR